MSLNGVAEPWVVDATTTVAIEHDHVGCVAADGVLGLANALADSLPGVSKPLEINEPKTPVPHVAAKARKTPAAASTQRRRR